MAKQRVNCIRRVTPKAPDEFISGLLALDGAWELTPGPLERWPMECPEGTVNLFGLRLGKAELRSGTVSGALQGGDGVLFQGRGPVLLAAEVRSECGLLRLRGEAAEQLLAGMPVCRFPGSGQAVWEAVQQVFALAGEDRSVSAGTASALAYQLLMSLHEMKSAPARAEHSPLVEAALGLIENEFVFLTGIEDLAGRMEVSREHLVREFHKEVGLPPGKYLNSRKLEYAKQLLLETDQNVSFVGEAAGFVNVNYFIRAFRKSVGVTPRVFRKQNGAAPEETTGVLDEFYVL